MIARGRRALLVYGPGHFQRQNILSNYDMRPWQAQTIVSLLEQAGIRVFTVWRDADLATIQPDVANWRIPSLALVRGTILGSTDFARYFSSAGRFALDGGRIAPIPSDEWLVLPAEQQFDAVLYLGPPSSQTYSMWTRDLCGDDAYRRMRATRIATVGLPPGEAEALDQHCKALVGR